MALEPPPETTHPSEDTAYEAVHQWAQEHGYGVKKHRTKEDKKGVVQRRNLECDRSGVHNVINPCRTRTGTRRTDCPFKVKLMRHLGDGETWKVEVVNPEHNHDESWDPKVHTCHRKRDREDVLSNVKALSMAGQPARVVMTALLQEHPDTLLVSRDIYNQRAALRRERLGGLTPIEALIKALEEDNEWLFEVKIDDETRRVTHLFFTISHSIDLMRSFPDVLLMDCTYKTNKFKMPLLHFLGVTPIETNFSAGFCFLPGESASDYL